MTERTHTPGPWLARKGSGIDPWIIDGEAGGIWALATCFDESDARLIAAAPDLLLIARRVAVYFEGLEGDLGNAALAAIEKATGEKSAPAADCPT